MSNKHFDIRELIRENPSVHLWNVVGQGGVGKTYSAKKLLLENYFKLHQLFIYVRRWTTEIGNDNLRTVFTDIEDDPEVMEWWRDWADIEKYPYFHVLPKTGWFYLCGEKANGDVEFLQPIGRATALSKAQTFKGGTYNDASVVFVDEFIADGRYVRGEREPDLLDKIVNTTGREKNEIMVICCGNPDFQIEMCPYLKNLMLDYANLQPNTLYLFDTKRSDGRIIANNVAFIKLAGYKGGRFLNEYTSNLWSTAEGEMRETGEVKTNKYMRPTEALMKGTDWCYELVIETAVKSNEEWNRKIYAYVGINEDDDAVIYVCRHRASELSEASDWSIFCRYDEFKLRRHDSDAQILRLRIPAGREFGPLQLMMDQADCSRLIYADDDQLGTLFESIRDFDKLRR